MLTRLLAGTKSTNLGRSRSTLSLFGNLGFFYWTLWIKNLKVCQVQKEIQNVHIEDFQDVHIPWTGQEQFVLWVWPAAVGNLTSDSLKQAMHVKSCDANHHAGAAWHTCLYIMNYISLGLMCHNSMLCAALSPGTSIMLSLRGLRPWQALTQVRLSRAIHSPLPALLLCSGAPGMRPCLWHCL